MNKSKRFSKIGLIDGISTVYLVRNGEEFFTKLPKYVFDCLKDDANLVLFTFDKQGNVVEKSYKKWAVVWGERLDQKHV